MPDKKTSEKKKHKPSPVAAFEGSLLELENLVEQMEHGNLSLEETLQHFERGVQLTSVCQKALSEAEQRVEVLQSKAQKSLQSLDAEISSDD